MDLALADAAAAAAVDLSELYPDPERVHEACKAGAEDALRELIGLGADLEYRRPRPPHNSPLHTACYHESIGCARLLVEAGVDRAVLNSEGLTAMALSASLGQNRVSDAVRLHPATKPVGAWSVTRRELKKEVSSRTAVGWYCVVPSHDPNPPPQFIVSAIAKQKRAKSTRHRIRRCLLVNAQHQREAELRDSRVGATVGQIRTEDSRLSREARAEARHRQEAAHAVAVASETRRTAAIDAISARDPAALAAVVRSGAFDLTVPMGDGRSILMLAADLDAVGYPMLRTLLQVATTAEVNIRGRDGSTLMHTVAEGNDDDMLSVLCEVHGAVPMADESGWLPMRSAQRKGAEKAVRYFALRDRARLASKESTNEEASAGSVEVSSDDEPPTPASATDKTAAETPVALVVVDPAAAANESSPAKAPTPVSSGPLIFTEDTALVPMMCEQRREQLAGAFEAAAFAHVDADVRLDAVDGISSMFAEDWDGDGDDGRVAMTTVVEATHRALMMAWDEDDAKLRVNGVRNFVAIFIASGGGAEATVVRPEDLRCVLQAVAALLACVAGCDASDRTVGENKLVEMAVELMRTDTASLAVSAVLDLVRDNKEAVDEFLPLLPPEVFGNVVEDTDALFDTLDVDNSGYLDEDEIYTLVCESMEAVGMRQNVSLSQVSEFLDIWDDDGNGVLDKTEFAGFMAFTKVMAWMASGG